MKMKNLYLQKKSRLSRYLMAFLGVLGVSFSLTAQGFAFEVEVGSWKGVGSLSLKGECKDSATGKPIEDFILRLDASDVPRTEKRVHAEKGTYHFNIETTIRNGKRYIKGLKKYRTLGPAEESLIIHIRSKGYEEKIITLAKDKVLINEVNLIDFDLNPRDIK